MEYKDPNDAYTFTANFTNELGGAGVATSVVTVPAGLTLDSEVVNGDGVDIKLSGGTAGNTYRVIVDIVSTAAEDFSKSFFVRVRQQQF
jgi:hypothetical protein